ncbi:MAG TPA: hypothetical protein VFN35_22665 [Ktedonobacteraceae bacterium]|nr:hypothetical protein [Ktedonobacteraceae bacterium]
MNRWTIYNRANSSTLINNFSGVPHAMQPAKSGDIPTPGSISQGSPVELSLWLPDERKWSPDEKAQALQATQPGNTPADHAI